MMTTHQTSSKSTQRVQAALETKGISFTIKELSSSARTALEAAQALGCEVAQIMKSLLFRTIESYRPVLVLASGQNRVNENQIKHLVGEEIVKAEATFTREVTGFAIGGIAPIAHHQKIDHIFIDEDLLKFDLLWAAAGTPHTVFCFRSADMSQLTSGIFTSIK